MIKTIRIEKIYPHPDNPRKRLGDLEELTESIRTFGVLQNLTVVPHKEHKGAYTVICGHRRLAAAKAAGLEELPCRIAEDMDERTQLNTMLMENMQRSDLTPQEEAQGFQMILDLGGSIAEIVKQTGLSETKVRHRIKLNELDQKMLEKKLSGTISINDLIKLEKIKDLARRNECLAKIGTNNFDWAVENALIEERKEIVQAKLERLLPEAEIATGWSPYPLVCQLEYRTCTDEEIESFAAKLKAAAKEHDAPAILCLGYEWTGRIKEETTRTVEKKEIPPEERARRKRIEDLESMKNRMIERGRKFVRGLSETTAKIHADKILPYAAEHMTTDWLNIDEDDMLDWLGREATEKSHDKTMSDVDVEYHIACQEEPYRIILIATFEAMAPTGWRNDFWNGNGEYIADMREVRYTRDLYVMMSSLGYEISDEEAGFIVGDSDLYLKEDKQSTGKNRTEKAGMK